MLSYLIGVVCKEPKYQQNSQFNKNSGQGRHITHKTELSDPFIEGVHSARAGRINLYYFSYNFGSLQRSLKLLNFLGLAECNTNSWCLRQGLWSFSFLFVF